MVLLLKVNTLVELSFLINADIFVLIVPFAKLPGHSGRPILIVLKVSLHLRHFLRKRSDQIAKGNVSHINAKKTAHHETRLS